MKYIWVSPEIFDKWGLDSQGGTVLDTEKIVRAYELWSRADTLVSNAKSNFDLSDAVLNLKRSLDRRLKLIEQLYSLREKEIAEKPKHYLDLLAHLKIVRPLLLHELLKVRNAIEHEDKNPPSKSECAKLVDIVWYFLKSTDNLVAIRRDGFETEHGKYFYGLDIDWKKSKVKMHGWFPSDYISETAKDNFLKVKLKIKETRADFKEDSQKSKDHKDKLPSDTWIMGTLVLSPQESLDLFRKIFEVFA